MGHQQNNREHVPNQGFCPALFGRTARSLCLSTWGLAQKRMCKEKYYPTDNIATRSTQKRREGHMEEFFMTWCTTNYSNGAQQLQSGNSQLGVTLQQRPESGAENGVMSDILLLLLQSPHDTTNRGNKTRLVSSSQLRNSKKEKEVEGDQHPG